MTKYKIKEIYYTLQGEGAHTGRPAVFLRFTGCNLWSGREEDRSEAVCQFCDTEFVGMDGPAGGKYSAEELAEQINSIWPENSDYKYVVCTGGEPLLQLNEALIDAFHRKHFTVAVETNGTIPLPSGLDWVCMSPKANTELVVKTGNELKLVVQQNSIKPEDFETWKFEHFFLQPMDGPELREHTQWASQYCLDHPKWKLSVQTHKVLGIK